MRQLREAVWGGAMYRSRCLNVVRCDVTVDKAEKQESIMDLSM